MTSENRKSNIEDELRRARQCIAAAEALLAAGLPSDAISRSYYAVFHVLRALLFSKGVESKSHHGALHLFNTEIVREGLMPSSHNRLLSGLQRARELADYDAAVVFSIDDARAELEAAKLFEAEALAVLQRMSAKE
jgi:uncharacterized protein (UPF0332 family)